MGEIMLGRSFSKRAPPANRPAMASPDRLGAERNIWRIGMAPVRRSNDNVPAKAPQRQASSAHACSAILMSLSRCRHELAYGCAMQSNSSAQLH
jgi:hypothetical protein